MSMQCRLWVTSVEIKTPPPIFINWWHNAKGIMLCVGVPLNWTLLWSLWWVYLTHMMPFGLAVSRRWQCCKCECNAMLHGSEDAGRTNLEGGLIVQWALEKGTWSEIASTSFTAPAVTCSVTTSSLLYPKMEHRHVTCNAATCLSSCSGCPSDCWHRSHCIALLLISKFLIPVNPRVCESKNLMKQDFLH